MTALKTKLVGLIEGLGAMSVAEYMAHCLSDPQHGYYMTREPFGSDGDFTTAPEVSQMFGELVGAWLVSAWRQIGSPAKPLIAEIGPGRGTLMKDIARTICKLDPGLLQASFHLIETSDRLAEIQANALKDSPGTFSWHTSLDELPEGPLFIVGNELFDALPTRQYIKTAKGWRERCISINDDGELIFVAGAGSLDPALLPPDAANAPDGSIFEVAPTRSALMQKIAERIAAGSGAGLLIDYGHLQSGLGDTLQAVLKHQYDPPLAHPGEADLTSHVDFAALAEQVHVAGLQPYLATQGDFLIRMGLLERAGALGAQADEATRSRLTEDVTRLADRDAMGELFKVLGFLSDRTPSAGFTG